MAEPDLPRTIGVPVRRPGIGAGVATVLPLGFQMAKGDRGNNVKDLQNAINAYFKLT